MPPSRTVARRRSRVTLIVLLAVLAALALFAVVARAAAAADSDAAAAAAVGLEDDGDYDDDDDVEEADKKPWTPPPSAPATSNTMRSLTLADITFQEFRYDLLAVSVILVYLAVHLYSRRSNLNVATSWLQRVMPVLNANFAHVGDEKKFNLIRDGPQDYIFFATGRRFVQTMYGYIKLFPTFDPAALAISYTNSTPTYDRVVVDMQLDPKLDGLVFAIMDKKKASKITKGRYDLTDFSIPTKANRRLPRHYVLTTDCPEFATAVLEDDEFVAALWESVGLAEGDEARGFKEPLFESIIFTDQSLKEIPEKIEDLKQDERKLVATLRFPEKPIETIGRTQMEALLALVDIYGTFNFTPEIRSRLRKVRQSSEEKIHKKQEEKRKEELAKQKLEALKKKEEDITKLSPAEQRKYHEKKQKEEMKKQMKKQSGMKIMK